MSRNPDPAFWSGRRVLLTGHSGFKGAWAALWLHRLGAEVHGFALAPETQPSLWRLAGQRLLASETIGDVRDARALAGTVARVRPQIVLHMAAQSLVRRGFADPAGTAAANVMGTVNLLEALRGLGGVEAALVVTTDKVYANGGEGRAFREDDPLGGSDPYSASKAAAELLTASYAASFFDAAGVPVATARAGNVIGGGDWAEDRLVPDLWRAAHAGVPLRLRAPGSVRPWQHVLEPLAGYFLHLEALAAGEGVPRAMNFGPAAGECLTVAELADAVGAALGAACAWERDAGVHPAEAASLALDATLAARTLGWTPRLTAGGAAAWTGGWYADHGAGGAARDLCLAQIAAYEALA
ncbi:MAG TPA: CDP-glucose 4,6-dehydratase [Allosphingosinicella sp.]